MLIRIVRYGVNHSELIIFDGHGNRMPSLDYQGTAIQCYIYIKGLARIIDEVGIESKSAKSYDLMRLEFEREIISENR